MRLPCAAGGFYPAEKAALSKLIRECYSHRLGPKGAAKKILGGVAPHAGYVYSGPAAAWFFHHLKASNPGTVVIIGPNHTGYGTGVSASSDDVWATPLGNISVDIPLRAKIAELCDEVVVEPLAHKFEHSIEVQLPFLLEMNPQAKFVPICLSATNPTICQKLGKALSKLNVPILASSDLSHYLPQKEANIQDHLVIEKILAMDPDGLFKVVTENDISMCGYAPVATMLWALKAKAKKADLLKYYTSGDIVGNMSAVVGYAAIAIS